MRSLRAGALPPICEASTSGSATAAAPALLPPPRPLSGGLSLSRSPSLGAASSLSPPPFAIQAGAREGLHRLRPPRPPRRPALQLAPSRPSAALQATCVTAGPAPVDEAAHQTREAGRGGMGSTRSLAVSRSEGALLPMDSRSRRMGSEPRHVRVPRDAHTPLADWFRHEMLPTTGMAHGGGHQRVVL